MRPQRGLFGDGNAEWDDRTYSHLDAEMRNRTCKTLANRCSMSTFDEMQPWIKFPSRMTCHISGGGKQARQETRSGGKGEKKPIRGSAIDVCTKRGVRSRISRLKRQPRN